MYKLISYIFILNITFQGCTFNHRADVIKFIGSDYVSYQSDDIRVYIPYFDKDPDLPDSCEPRKQLEFLFDSEVIDGFQFIELLKQNQPDDSFLKKEVNDFSNKKKCINDYENYKGRIIFFELVFLEKLKDKQKKVLTLYANTTGWSPGPIIHYQIEITSDIFDENCFDNLRNASKIQLEYIGLQL